MSKADCIPDLFESEDIANAENLKRISKKWFDNGAIQAYTKGRHRDFETFYHQTLPHLDFQLSRIPNAKELKTLERKMNSYLKQLNKGTPSALGKLFKLPENILSKTPVSKKYFGDMVRISNYYRGELQDITSDLKLIETALNKASAESTIMNKFSLTRKNAQKKLQDLYTDYKRYKKEGKNEAAEAFYQEHLSDKALRNADHQLQTMQRLWELMTNPDLIAKQDPTKVKLDYGADLYDAASAWHFGSGNKPAVKDRLWKILGNGLKANIDMLKLAQSDYNTVNFQVKKLEQLYNDYFSKNAPNKPKDYFPRQVLDIAPTFTRLSDDMHSGYLDKHPGHVTKYIDRMVTEVRENLKVPGHTFERALDAPVKTSKDVLDILNTYAHNTVRFNYNANVSKSTIKALRDLHELSGTDFDSHLQFMSEYIKDTHDAALGLKFRNNKLTNISRAITSWEFISKLGFNARTVARNATQSLQNWVYFGNKAIKESMRDMHSDKYKTMLAEEMARHGYEFVNIQEFAMPRELMSNLNLDSSGKVVQSEASTASKWNNYLEKVATFAGKPMQWVENHVNRGLTFKIAFTERYNALKNDTILRQQLKKAEGKGLDGAEFNALVEKTRRNQASRYAANMVKELHYLYDPWAKPAITRNPVGSVLGQFTTYSINFFEYQRKIAAKGGSDILAREWNSPEAWRLYRLGMLYTAVTGLGAITNTKWSNLVQNDTWERITRLDQYLRGDEKAKEKAFFGKDPITATFGGPFVSDVMKIGSLINFQRMNSSDFNSYHQYYHDAAKRTKDKKIEEFVRTLNTQIGRLIYTTGPRMINGAGFPTLLGQELGLYNTPELSNIKDKMLYPLQEFLPKPASTYFTPEKPKKKRSKPKPNSQYSDQEIQNIMMILDSMQKSQLSQP